jgi:hypothetical protein
VADGTVLFREGRRRWYGICLGKAWPTVRGLFREECSRWYGVCLGKSVADCKCSAAFQRSFYTVNGLLL